MGLEINRRSLPDGLPGAYTEFVEHAPPSLLVSQDLSYEEQDALIAEAECYQVRGPRARRKFCYSPRTYEKMDRERVRALRRCIEEIRPDWVEQIRMAVLMDNESTLR